MTIQTPTPSIATGTHIPQPSKHNSDTTASDNSEDHITGISGDDVFGNDGNIDPGDQPPINKIPDVTSGNSNHDVQHNLVDATSVLTRSMQRQGDGSHSKVRPPNPFNGTDSAKLRTSLIWPQTSPSNQDKKQSALQKTGLSSWSSNRKTSNLGNKLGKDGKLTPVEQIHRFANNLCLFCGGIGHIAKECPKPSSSAAKARSCAAKEKSNESNSTHAEDLTK
jgi:Zinc knuckle